MRIEALIAALSGRHRIERELGQGGWRRDTSPEDPRQERLVAIEVPNPDLAAVVGA